MVMKRIDFIKRIAFGGILLTVFKPVFGKKEDKTYPRVDRVDEGYEFKFNQDGYAATARVLTLISKPLFSGNIPQKPTNHAPDNYLWQVKPSSLEEIAEINKILTRLSVYEEINCQSVELEYQENNLTVKMKDYTGDLVKGYIINKNEHLSITEF